MITVFAALCILVMTLLLALNLFGLPANWVSFAIACLWGIFVAGDAIGLGFLLLLAAICLVGEVLEFFLQAWGSKRYGGSGRGTIGGMIGAFAGAILGAPILFGLGAFIGALAGAFCGSLLVELAHRRPLGPAATAAWGTMLGRFGGSVLKMACGFAMVALAAPRIWEGA